MGPLIWAELRVVSAGFLTLQPQSFLIVQTLTLVILVGRGW